MAWSVSDAFQEGQGEGRRHPTGGRSPAGSTGGFGFSITIGQDGNKPPLEKVDFDVFTWWYDAEKRYKELRYALVKAVDYYQKRPSLNPDEQQNANDLTDVLKDFPESQPFSDLRPGDFDRVFRGAPDQKELKEILLRVNEIDKEALAELKNAVPRESIGSVPSAPPAGPVVEANSVFSLNADKVKAAVEVRKALKPEIISRRDLQETSGKQTSEVTIYTLSGSAEVTGFGISYSRQRDQFFKSGRHPVRGPSRTKVEVIAGPKVFFAKDPKLGTEQTQDELINRSTQEVNINVG